MCLFASPSGIRGTQHKFTRWLRDPRFQNTDRFHRFGVRFQPKFLLLAGRHDARRPCCPELAQPRCPHPPRSRATRSSRARPVAPLPLAVAPRRYPRSKLALPPPPVGHGATHTLDNRMPGSTPSPLRCSLLVAASLAAACYPLSPPSHAAVGRLGFVVCGCLGVVWVVEVDWWAFMGFAWRWGDVEVGCRAGLRRSSVD